MSSITVFTLTGNKRLALWALLVLLTLLIFLYPARLTPESQPVESMYVFANLPLFGALYSIWFAVLLVLALSRGGERTDDLEKLALVCTFTLVFAGIWVSLRGSYAVEASRDASNIAYLNQYGQIPLTGNIYRTVFPGVAILGSAISQITRLADFDVLTTLLILQILLFPIMLYLMFKNIIGDSRWAVLGVLLAIAGNIMIAKQLFQFHPSSFAIFFLFTPFLLVLTGSQGFAFRTWQKVLLLLILLLAVTVTHFVTAACFLLVLLGVLMVQQPNKTRLVTLSIVALCAVILISLWTYLVPSTFGSLANFISQIAESFRKGLFISGYIAALADAYTREGIPLWANITRYYWAALFLVFAAILGVKNFIRARRLTEMESKVTGGLVGIGFLLLGTFVAAGAAELYRVLSYAPFFAVPTVVMFFYKLRNPLRGYSFIALAALLLVFSFPTFLAHNNTVGTTAYYSYEFSGCEWLKSQYGGRVGVYITGGPQHPLDYYIEREYDFGAEFEFIADKTEAGYWKELNRQVTVFQDRGKQSISLYVLEERTISVVFKHLLGVDYSTRPEWHQLTSRLSQENLIYNSGYMQFYKVG